MASLVGLPDPQDRWEDLPKRRRSLTIIKLVACRRRNANGQPMERSKAIVAALAVVEWTQLTRGFK